MTAAHQIRLITVEEYLADERVSEVKHEYTGGYVYAMAGGRNVHNTVATAFLIAVGTLLRGKPCQPFNSDTKVRVLCQGHTRFYYPDAMIVCEPNPADDTFQDKPVVIAEVISESTRRIDEGEKRDAYLTLPTLSTYLLIDTASPGAVVYQRSGDGFIARRYDGRSARVPLPALGVDLPLEDLYERVNFADFEPDGPVDR